MCRKRVSSPRCGSELIDSAWVVIAPGQKCINIKIYNYLSDRKQRTKVNNSFRTWSDITAGIPQGSILGPLLFNMYLNDTFYFVHENKLTNYADDNTPYVTDSNTDAIIDKLVHDTST